jgi:hypothetical protein
VIGYKKNMTKLIIKTMNQPQHNPNNDNNSFRLGVIFSNKGMIIFPQGKFSLSYQQLWKLLSKITVVSLFINRGIAILSHYGIM